MEQSLELALERHDGTTVVTAAGEIDMATASELRECLIGTQGRVVVDLRGVSFLDSSGIATLVTARARLLESSGDLQLRKPQGIVRKVLEVTGLDSWIED
jgi:anti-anti-sigma factor